MPAKPDKPLRIGLTGGIASGKTAVADLFAGLGATVVDTDVIAREVVAPGEPGLAAIKKEFGDSILNPDGTLDRSALREIVFTDPQRKTTLEALLHPLIRAATIAQLEQTAANADYQIVVVPLLLETGFIELVDRVLVVDCPEQIQLSRLKTRDGSDADTAQAIISAQTGRQQRLSRADDVIDNSGALAELEPAVRALHKKYLDIAG